MKRVIFAILVLSLSGTARANHSDAPVIIFGDQVSPYLTLPNGNKVPNPCALTSASQNYSDPVPVRPFKPVPPAPVTPSPTVEVPKPEVSVEDPGTAVAPALFLKGQGIWSSKCATCHEPPANFQAALDKVRSGEMPKKDEKNVTLDADEKSALEHFLQAKGAK